MVAMTDLITAAQRIEFYNERKQSRDIDGRPTVTDFTGYDKYDPLLEALILVHGQPRRDLFPGTHN